MTNPIEIKNAAKPVDLFMAKHAIQSLRESDFDDLSAYGEAIDNSLQAGASEIRIKFSTEKRRNKLDIQSLAFGDDGVGMDSETLHQCLQLGWSSRMNDRTGIGRFGVGMTLGAIHECKRIEVWSKQKGEKWLYTYIDLDEIMSDSMTSIPIPEERPLPPQFKDLAGKDSGTLVVWRSYDRQERSADKIIEDFRVWAGRTYRYFIWGTDHKGEAVVASDHRSGPVRMWIDGESVKAIDPLYARTEMTAFPDDPPADLYKEIIITWKADINAPKPGADTPIAIRMSLLPEEFRKKEGQGGGPHATSRHIDHNEGISIMRNHREVFYGSSLNWQGGKGGWPNFERVDRWWGGEILFTAEVDRSFTVKNIKRGAKPQTQLKLAIKEKMLGTRNTCNEIVRAVWKQTKIIEAEDKEKKEAEELLQRAGKHELAEGTAAKTPTPKSQIDKDKNLDAESEEAAKSYSDRFDDDQQQRLAELFKSQPFTVMQENWKGPLFYEPKFLGGRAVLDYNMGHEFWDRVYELVNSLGEEGVDPSDTALEIRVMLDLLIFSHAKAESMFDKDVEYTAEGFLDQMRQNWGLYLKSYVQTRKKESGQTED